MLVKTAQQDSLLSSEVIKYKTKITLQRNEVADTDVANHIDITSIVNSMQIQYDLDRRNATCTLELDNTSGLYTPKNASSATNKYQGVYNPLIYPNHKLRVWLYLDDSTLNDPFMPNSNNPAWQVFTGYTGDEIDIDTNEFTIGLQVRDKSKKLQDTYIELSKSYDAMLAEDVVFDILTTHCPEMIDGMTNNPLETRENWLLILPLDNLSTNYLIEHYQIKDSNVWDAIQKIADLMGWVIRFNGKGQLLFYQEAEDIINPQYTINPDLIISDSQGISDADIRNDIIVKSQNQNYDFIESRYRNEDSISTFGWRPMIVSVDLTAYINTYNQAYQLSKAICRDLSYIHENDSCMLPLSPFIEVGDIISLVNPRSSTGDSGTELYKILNVSFNISAKEKRTSLTITKYKNLPPLGVISTPKAPTGLNAPLGEFINREEYVYDNATSSWLNNKQTVKYPKLKWTEVTQNTDGSAVNNLQGYTIYRQQINASGSVLQDYRAISSVRAYFQDNSATPITYFIDYNCQPDTINDKIFNYRITAHNNVGQESDYSTGIQVTVPKIVVV